jgi:hypothetical protein
MRLSTRDVERASLDIARQKNNQEYYLSHGWLTDIENGRFVPGIFKLYSLSVIYNCPYDSVLGCFGIRIRDTAKEQRSVTLPNTHLIEPGESPSMVRLPVQLRDAARLEDTNLVSRMFERWSDIPIDILRQMEDRTSICGYIGLKDYTLHPLIRPGSIVQIDPRQRRILGGTWQTAYDRPIYFLELRDSYVCSWCQLQGNQLMVIPYPQSGEQVRQVRYPAEAGIIGRVTAVTMRIADSSQTPIP